MLPRCHRILVALAVLSTASAGRSGEAAAHGGAVLARHSVGCPADIVRNSALGIALTLPTGWQDYGYTLFAPGGLFVANPAVQNGKGYPLGLGMIPAGTTAEHNDARAVAAAVQRSLRGIPFTVTRAPLTIGGAPAVLLAPMPGAGPTVEIVLAHQSALYTILAFKNRDSDPLRPDQLQALASLRFIPRVGPFPRATVPPPNAPLPQAPSLVLAGAAGSRGALTVRARGKGYRPGEAVELQACWTGTPRLGAHPLYTWYRWAGVARATSRGLLDTLLTIPVAPAAYTTSHLRVMATDARIGQRLATAISPVPVRSSIPVPDVTRRFSVTGDGGSQSSPAVSGQT